MEHELFLQICAAVCCGAIVLMTIVVIADTRDKRKPYESPKAESITGEQGEDDDG